MRALTRFALLILIASAVVPASARQLPTTEVLEATASMLSMPSVSDGILLMKACQDCKERTLRASASTQYVLNKQQVTLNDFSAFVREHGDAFVSVTYDIPGSRLLALKASVAGTSVR